MKKQKNIRMSKLTDRQLSALVDETGMTQTELISTAIDRMYREEIKMNAMEIRIRTSEDALFGEENPNNYNVGASLEKYEDLVLAGIRNLYPRAQVDFEWGINNDVSVDGQTDRDEADWIGQVIADVWNDWNWIVSN